MDIASVVLGSTLNGISILLIFLFSMGKFSRKLVVAGGSAGMLGGTLAFFEFGPKGALFLFASAVVLLFLLRFRKIFLVVASSVLSALALLSFEVVGNVLLWLHISFSAIAYLLMSLSFLLSVAEFWLSKSLKSVSSSLLKLPFKYEALRSARITISLAGVLCLSVGVAIVLPYTGNIKLTVVEIALVPLSLFVFALSMFISGPSKRVLLTALGIFAILLTLALAVVKKKFHVQQVQLSSVGWHIHPAEQYSRLCAKARGR